MTGAPLPVEVEETENCFKNRKKKEKKKEHDKVVFKKGDINRFNEVVRKCGGGGGGRTASIHLSLC